MGKQWTHDVLSLTVAFTVCHKHKRSEGLEHQSREYSTAEDALLGMKAKYGDGLRSMNSLERYEELMNILEEIAEEDDSIHQLDIVHPDLAACIEEHTHKTHTKHTKHTTHTHTNTHTKHTQKDT